MLFSAEIYIFNIVSAGYSQVFVIFAAVIKKCTKSVAPVCFLIHKKNSTHGFLIHGLSSKKCNFASEITT